MRTKLQQSQYCFYDEVGNLLATLPKAVYEEHNAQLREQLQGWKDGTHPSQLLEGCRIADRDDKIKELDEALTAVCEERDEYAKEKEELESVIEEMEKAICINIRETCSQDVSDYLAHETEHPDKHAIRLFCEEWSGATEQARKVK